MVTRQSLSYTHHISVAEGTKQKRKNNFKHSSLQAFLSFLKDPHYLLDKSSADTQVSNASCPEWLSDNSHPLGKETFKMFVL